MRVIGCAGWWMPRVLGDCIHCSAAPLSPFCYCGLQSDVVQARFEGYRGTGNYQKA